MLVALLTLTLHVDSAWVVVWGGGKTPADADKALADWKEKSVGGQWSGYVKLGDGFPRVMKSDAVKGMNPGFHIVVLGACKNEDAAATVDMFKVFEPSVYSKWVEWPEAPSCPSGIGKWTWAQPVRVKGKDYALAVVSFGSDNEEDPTWNAVRYEPKGGAAVVTWFIHRDCSGGGVEERGSSVAVNMTCITGRCTSWGHSEFRATYSVKDGKIEEKMKETKVIDKAVCD